jgi:type I restriction enzyme S subunit
VNNHAHILKPKRGDLEYLAGFMETLNYQPWISGAAQPKLTKDRIMAITVAIAPPPEQASIVEYTLQQTDPLRSAIEKAEREVALLREYRTRLVADVVTGKLDVRAAAANLPEAEEIAEASAEISDGAESDPAEVEEADE